MEYLRNLGSAAVSTLVQKSGLNLPFSLGRKVSVWYTFWTLYEATKRDDGSSVSVFEYDLTQNKNQIPLARNALRKLRTIRHPNILKFLDVVETDSTIFIMTERVRPLSIALQARSSKPSGEQEDWLLWGLHQVSVALAFVNDSCSSTHGNLRLESVFESPSGEWKLGGFEVLSNPTDAAAVIYTMGHLLPGAPECAPPEVKRDGWSNLKEHDVSAADGYCLGLLLHSVFNPSQPPPPTSHPPHLPPQPSSRGAIPTSIFPSFKKMLNPNPKARMSPKTFLELGMAQTSGEGSGFFANNRLVVVSTGLNNFNLASEAEKATLIRMLKQSASAFPPEFTSFRVLPSLVSALEYGGASAAAILPLVVQFGKNVASEDYANVVLTPLIKLYASPDRGIRMALLDQLPEYAEKLDKKAVVDKIWPHLQAGFSDTVAVIRESTVKAVILLASKLNDRILNNDLLRHLAKMQSDPEASIRTNACILIGRLGPSLGYNTKRKILVPAFVRALKDPFVHARVAGLMAFMATTDCFDVEEIATKVIPNISFTLLDKEKLVRDQAFKAVELFIERLESHAATMPETAQGDENAFQLPSPGTTGQAALVNSAAGAAGALADWAISSLGKTMTSADMQLPIGVAASVVSVTLDRPTSAPPPLTNTNSQSTRPSPLVSRSTASAARSTVSSSSTFSQAAHVAKPKAKALQLKSNTGGLNNVSSLAAQLAEEAAAEDAGNPWGNDDLIDLNADEDDWSAFENAPAVNSKPEPARAVSGLGISVSNGKTIFSPAEPDGWGNVEPSPQSNGDFWKTTSPSTQPHKLLPSSRAPALSSPSSSNTTTVSSSMSREEKAAEMARRKEERRQRIEKLKEQNKRW